MNNNYSFKDAFKLLKAVADICDKIYKAKSEMIIRSLEKSEDKQDRSLYGLFSLKNNKAKTVKTYTETEQKEFDELQAQIDKLKEKQNTLGTETVIKEAYNSLVYHKSEEAEKEAYNILSSLLETINNPSMLNVANGLAEKSK